MESAGRFPDSYRRRDIHGRPPLNFRVPPTVVVTEPEEDVAAREEAEREERREQLRRDWAEFVRLRTLAWGFYLPPSSWDRRDSGCSACVSNWNDDAEREERERLEAPTKEAPTAAELAECEQREADLRAQWSELSTLERSGEGIREPLRGHGQGEDAGSTASGEVPRQDHSGQHGPAGDWENPDQPAGE